MDPNGIVGKNRPKDGCDPESRGTVGLHAGAAVKFYISGLHERLDMQRRGESICCGKN